MAQNIKSKTQHQTHSRITTGEQTIHTCAKLCYRLPNFACRRGSITFCRARAPSAPPPVKNMRWVQYIRDAVPRAALSELTVPFRDLAQISGIEPVTKQATRQRFPAGSWLCWDHSLHLQGAKLRIACPCCKMTRRGDAGRAYFAYPGLCALSRWEIA